MISTPNLIPRKQGKLVNLEKENNILFWIIFMFTKQKWKQTMKQYIDRIRNGPHNFSKLDYC